jgi:hypothetical protein
VLACGLTPQGGDAKRHSHKIGGWGHWHFDGLIVKVESKMCETLSLKFQFHTPTGK